MLLDRLVGWSFAWRYGPGRGGGSDRARECHKWLKKKKIKKRVQTKTSSRKLPMRRSLEASKRRAKFKRQTKFLPHCFVDPDVFFGDFPFSIGERNHRENGTSFWDWWSGTGSRLSGMKFRSHIKQIVRPRTHLGRHLQKSVKIVVENTSIDNQAYLRNYHFFRQNLTNLPQNHVKFRIKYSFFYKF